MLTPVGAGAQKGRDVCTLSTIQFSFLLHLTVYLFVASFGITLPTPLLGVFPV